MFIKYGSTRKVRCYPSLGIVIKTAREYPKSFRKYFSDSESLVTTCGNLIDDMRHYCAYILKNGVEANKAEAYLWKKTHNPLLAPVLFSFFGWMIVMPYYPKAVKLGKHIDGHLPKELRVELIKKTFYPLTEKILGKHIRHFFLDGHNVMNSNFRLTESGRLAMTDYGIVQEDEQEMFVKFLNEYGTKLVAEYSEPPQ